MRRAWDRCVSCRRCFAVQRDVESMVAAMLTIVFALAALAIMDVFESTREDEVRDVGFYAGLLARAALIAAPPLLTAARLSARLNAVLEAMYELPAACVADPLFAPLLLTLVGRCTQGHLSFRVLGVSVKFSTIGKLLAAIAGISASAVVLAQRLAAGGK